MSLARRVDTSPALLVLADGAVFHGRSIAVEGHCIGEVVFNTAMTGYQEILTDPSYCRQIVTLTYPHIGNTGTNSDDAEAGGVHVAGLVIRDLPSVASNFRSQQCLSDYLIQHNVVAIADVDTRRLTRHVRKNGAQAGCILCGPEINVSYALEMAKEFPGLAGMDLAREVSCEEAYVWDQETWSLPHNRNSKSDAHQGSSMGSTDHRPHRHVVAVDFGVKRNILRMLVDRGCKVTVVPAQTAAQTILDLQPDGVFLSNGPGDPEPCKYAIEAIRNILETNIPVFGICLGHQLLALASGARTIKMKFGHHGANHPVQELASGRVMISSQNHGFAVDPDSLGNVLHCTHISLFDGSVQGIARTDKPAFGFQGHPEASPGPHDVADLFDQFVTSIDTAMDVESHA